MLLCLYARFTPVSMLVIKRQVNYNKSFFTLQIQYQTHFPIDISPPPDNLTANLSMETAYDDGMADLAGIQAGTFCF